MSDVNKIKSDIIKSGIIAVCSWLVFRDILVLGSLFCCWLIFLDFQSRRVVRVSFNDPPPSKLYKPYIFVLAMLALLFAWQPFHIWRFERFLSSVATELADGHSAKVHCNSMLDTAIQSIHEGKGGIAHANPKTGEITIEPFWCGRLMDYLDHPDRANQNEIASLNMLTHESMHVRGEYNEVITECEAVQRDYRAAKLLGVPDKTAKKNALEYYNTQYPLNMFTYFSDKCGPEKDMDEHLVDSTWANIEQDN